jgi:H+/Cl- antiporter ClcA
MLQDVPLNSAAAGPAPAVNPQANLRELASPLLSPRGAGGAGRPAPSARRAALVRGVEHMETVDFSDDFVTLEHENAESAALIDRSLITRVPTALEILPNLGTANPHSSSGSVTGPESVYGRQPARRDIDPALSKTRHVVHLLEKDFINAYGPRFLRVVGNAPTLPPQASVVAVNEPVPVSVPAPAVSLGDGVDPATGTRATRSASRSVSFTRVSRSGSRVSAGGRSAAGSEPDADADAAAAADGATAAKTGDDDDAKNAAAGDNGDDVAAAATADDGHDSGDDDNTPVNATVRSANPPAAGASSAASAASVAAAGTYTGSTTGIGAGSFGSGFNSDFPGSNATFSPDFNAPHFGAAGYPGSPAFPGSPAYPGSPGYDPAAASKAAGSGESSPDGASSATGGGGGGSGPAAVGDSTLDETLEAERVRRAKSYAQVNFLESVWPQFTRFLICFIIGIVVAFFGLGIEFTIRSMYHFLINVITFFLQADGGVAGFHSAGGWVFPVLAMLFGTLVTLVYSIGCVIVSFMGGYYPIRGSGIPHLVAYLDGSFNSRLPIWTLAVLMSKAISVSFALAANIKSGLQGPLIHMGGLIARQITKLCVLIIASSRTASAVHLLCCCFINKHGRCRRNPCQGPSRGNAGPCASRIARCWFAFERRFNPSRLVIVPAVHGDGWDVIDRRPAQRGRGLVEDDSEGRSDEAGTEITYTLQSPQPLHVQLAQRHSRLDGNPNAAANADLPSRVRSTSISVAAAAAAAAANAGPKLSSLAEARLRVLDYLMTNVEPGLRHSDEIMPLLNEAIGDAPEGGVPAVRRGPTVYGYDFGDDDDEEEEEEEDEDEAPLNAHERGVSSSGSSSSGVAASPPPVTVSGQVIMANGTVLLSLPSPTAGGDRAPASQVALASELTVSGMLQTLAKSLSGPGDEHNFIACGAAAGFTAAFNAPLAGIVMLQGMAKESMSFQLTLRLFFTSLAAVLVTNLVKGKHSILPDRGFIDVDMPSVPAMTTVELVVVVFLGIFSGLVGVLFTKLSLLLAKFRINKLGHKIWPHMWFVTVLSALLVIPGVILTLTFPCTTIDEDSFPMCITHPNRCYRLSCPEGTMSQVGTLFFGSPDMLVRLLWDRSEGQHNQFSFGVTLTFLLGYFILTNISYMCAAPGGFFMPAIVVGGIFGRFFGMIVGYLGATSNLGVYAVLGSVGMLAAINRLTLPMAVMMIEFTSDAQFITPIMIVIICSKFLADSLVGGLEGEEMKLRTAYLTLGERPHPALSKVTAAEIIEASNAVAAPVPFNPVPPEPRYRGQAVSFGDVSAYNTLVAPPTRAVPENLRAAYWLARLRAGRAGTFTVVGDSRIARAPIPLRDPPLPGWHDALAINFMCCVGEVDTTARIRALLQFTSHSAFPVVTVLPVMRRDAVRTYAKAGATALVVPRAPAEPARASSQLALASSAAMGGRHSISVTASARAMMAFASESDRPLSYSSLAGLVHDHGVVEFGVGAFIGTVSRQNLEALLQRSASYQYVAAAARQRQRRQLVNAQPSARDFTFSADVPAGQDRPRTRDRAPSTAERNPHLSGSRHVDPPALIDVSMSPLVRFRTMLEAFRSHPSTRGRSMVALSLLYLAQQMPAVQEHLRRTAAALRAAAAAADPEGRADTPALTPAAMAAAANVKRVPAPERLAVAANTLMAMTSLPPMPRNLVECFLEITMAELYGADSLDAANSAAALEAGTAGAAGAGGEGSDAPGGESSVGAAAVAAAARSTGCVAKVGAGVDAARMWLEAYAADHQNGGSLREKKKNNREDGSDRSPLLGGAEPALPEALRGSNLDPAEATEWVNVMHMTDRGAYVVSCETSGNRLWRMFRQVGMSRVVLVDVLHRPVAIVTKKDMILGERAVASKFAKEMKMIY